MAKIKSVLNYTSVCCGVLANKPPCERSKEDRKEGKFSQASLGKWHCGKCRKGCKVRVTKVKDDNGN